MFNNANILVDLNAHQTRCHALCIYFYYKIVHKVHDRQTYSKNSDMLHIPCERETRFQLHCVLEKVHTVFINLIITLNQIHESIF